jgi:hypothetical protein
MDKLATTSIQTCPDLDKLVATSIQTCPDMDKLAATSIQTCPDMDKLAATSIQTCPDMDKPAENSIRTSHYPKQQAHPSELQNKPTVEKGGGKGLRSAIYRRNIRFRKKSLL